MLKKTINIDGKDVEFKASAAVPRIYRLMFGRDIFRDMTRMARNLKKEQKKAQEESGETGGSELPIEDLEMFENVAYVMARHANPHIPNTIEEWLDEFDTFSIYKILPELLALWNLNTETQIKGKKKLGQLSGR